MLPMNAVNNPSGDWVKIPPSAMMAVAQDYNPTAMNRRVVYRFRGHSFVASHALHFTKFTMNRLTMKKTLLLLALCAFCGEVRAQVSGWKNGDVGAPSVSGNASEASGTVTISDAGLQLYDRQKSSGHAVYNRTKEEGSSKWVTARITAISSPDPQAQACVGFFDGRNHDSRFAALCITKSAGLKFYSRYAERSFAVVAELSGITAPVYLRARRVLDATAGGYDVTAQYSSDGSTWTTVGTVRVPQLAYICMVGVATSAHSTSLQTTTVTNLASDYTPLSAFYVSPTASGSGNGSEDSPWTLDQAWRTQFGSIPAGSILFMRDGSAGNPVNQQPYRAKLTVKTSGTLGSPIEHRAYPGELPIVNGRVVKRLVTPITAATGPNSCGFTLDNGDFLESGVKLSIDGPGIRGEDLRVTNCTVGCTVIGDATPTGCLRGDNGTTPATYPAGQIVGIWGTVVTVTGSYNDFYDLEVTQDAISRVNVDGRYAGVTQNEDQQWPSFVGPAFSNQGVKNNFYGLNINNNADGMSGFTATDGDMDSIYIHNNGGGGNNRCNGHGTYLQSKSPNTRYIRRAMSINNFAAAIKIGAVSGPVLNYSLLDSIGQNGGAQCLRGSWGATGQGVQTLDLVTDGLPIQNATVDNSVFWGNPKSSTQVAFFGYVNANNDNGTLTNSYILNGNRLLLSQNWRRLNLSGNFFYATNTAQAPEIVNSKWTTYGPFAGKANLTGTTLTRVSGDNFQPTSWSNSLCVEGCQSQLSLSGGACGNGNYNVVVDSVSADGQTLQLTQGVAGTCSNLNFSVSQVQSHPIAGSYAYNNNTYWNNLAGNDFGTTPASSDNATYVFAWSRNARSAAIANVFHATSGICSGGSTLTAPPNFSGPTDCSWRGWSGNDATSTFNTGKPTSAANFVKFYKLIDGLATGWRAFVWAQDWADTGLVTLSSANLDTIMKPGDLFEVRKGENYDAIVFSGTYAGSTITFNVTDQTVKAAKGHGYNLKSTFPRGGALIVRVK